MSKIDKFKIESLCRELLIAIGENPDREGILDTPKRYAKWWEEFILGGPPGGDLVLTSFPTETNEQLVIVSNITAWSLCEHHLLPFSVKVSIGYITKDRILGLSKFARIVAKVASKLQVQERLTEDISSLVSKATGSDSVAVKVKGEHLCMIMRGAKSSASMITNSFTGSFKEDSTLRSEFLATT